MVIRSVKVRGREGGKCTLGTWVPMLALKNHKFDAKLSSDHHQ